MYDILVAVIVSPRIAAGLVLLAFIPFAWKRFLTYLHIFQQDEYDGGRFMRWLLQNAALDMRASIGILVLWSASRLYPSPPGIIAVFHALILLRFAFRETDPRKVGKKKLHMTQRAARILRVAFMLVLLAGLAGAGFGLATVWVVVLIQAIPLALVAAAAILQPGENRIQQRFWNEAHEKLKSLSPVVIGVTGSYGKTSTKHILGHLLESTGSALITPGSVNTPMGIARIVREQLEPHHRHFVVEMGAYGPGSIERLCRLTPPDIAVVTAVGPAHYERFKSLDVVARTKFELPAAAVAKGGKAIINQAVLTFADARAFVESHSGSVTRVGQGEGVQAQINSVEQKNDGLHVSLFYAGQDYQLFAPLYGQHHGTNMAMAFVTALAMGVDPQIALVAMKSTPQISHRLEVKRQGDGTTIIDDAYNSNPAGFAAALEILPLFVEGEGRRILVTPGMVELGEAHAEEHRKLGVKAGQTVDILLAVVPERIRDFIDAYRAARPEGEIIECAGFARARDWMAANLRKGDVVLLENDLPDLYERRLQL